MYVCMWTLFGIAPSIKDNLFLLHPLPPVLKKSLSLELSFGKHSLEDKQLNKYECLQMEDKVYITAWLLEADVNKEDLLDLVTLQQRFQSKIANCKGVERGLKFPTQK